MRETFYIQCQKQELKNVKTWMALYNLNTHTQTRTHNWSEPIIQLCIWYLEKMSITEIGSSIMPQFIKWYLPVMQPFIPIKSAHLYLQDVLSLKDKMDLIEYERLVEEGCKSLTIKFGQGFGQTHDCCKNSGEIDGNIFLFDQRTLNRGQFCT